MRLVSSIFLISLVAGLPAIVSGANALFVFHGNATQAEVYDPDSLRPLASIEVGMGASHAFGLADPADAGRFGKFYVVSPAAVSIFDGEAWGGYERMVEDGQFTWPLPFWKQPSRRWTAMMGVGVRSAFVASARAARMMVPAGGGLIVNISYWAAQKYHGNVIYGVAKAATDKMTSDMAHELRGHGVAAVSLYPGLVRTEAVLSAAEGGVFDLSNSESPEFIGRVIAALADDPLLIERTGGVLIAAQVAIELGVKDVDGKQPRPLTLDAS